MNSATYLQRVHPLVVVDCVLLVAATAMLESRWPTAAALIAYFMSFTVLGMAAFTPAAWFGGAAADRVILFVMRCAGLGALVALVLGGVPRAAHHWLLLAVGAVLFVVVADVSRVRLVAHDRLLLASIVSSGVAGLFASSPVNLGVVSLCYALWGGLAYVAAMSRFWSLLDPARPGR
jgi:hypothetical protein